MPAFAETFDLADLDGENGFHLVSEAGSYNFGYSIATLGDVNGDGFDDIAVNSFDGPTILLGGQGPFAPSTTVSNEFPFETRTATLPDDLTEYESWIVGIGDVNGDGFADFDHHAFYATETYYEYEYGDSWTEIFFHDYGRIQYGGGSAATTGKRFGDRGLEDVDPSWLVPLGDVNGDGFDDVVVYVQDGSHPKVVFGSATGLPDNVNRGSAPSLAFTGASPFEINGAGDVNGDGITDVVVGVSDSSGVDHYVVYGGAGLAPGFFDLTSLDGTNGFKLTDARTVGTVGDVDGDGLDDLVVSMSGRTSSDPYYVVYGRAAGPAAIDASAVDGSDGFQIVNAGTRWVGRAGDINADGLDDFLIGNDYVVFGRADVGTGGLDATSVDGDNGFQIVATGIDTTSSWGGLIVQAAGDVNGDGVDDLVAGTRLENSVHVILGHAASAVNWVGTSARENHGGSPENDVLNGAGGNDYLRGWAVTTC
ncbi:hypothetical protein D3874_14300 [Oleomonas cavernae]|uniref:VCBS repeat-containing protein n=1 Tax=Oleomonas cavernae TaxID=2320859 RepID=A0A418WDE2_9PROT|nr:integrin alpha [Oleomonas cavernae]RJF88043.1 hypothetical protein D3874_14300 [Oleomonas cavernae]